MNDLTTGETATANATQNGVTRRGVLTAFSMAAVIAGLSPLDAFAQAAGNSATAQKIANHFSSVKTMMGNSSSSARVVSRPAASFTSNGPASFVSITRTLRPCASLPTAGTSSLAI